jgi:hypothetical protein
MLVPASLLFVFISSCEQTDDHQFAPESCPYDRHNTLTLGVSAYCAHTALTQEIKGKVNDCRLQQRSLRRGDLGIYECTDSEYVVWLYENC